MAGIIMKRLRRRKAGLFVSAFVFCLFFPMKGYGAGTDQDFRLVFDAEYYYSQNPDLQEAVGMDPESLFRHFVTTGIREGRSGNAEFNLKAYVYYNQDLLDAYKTDWAAYCRHYETAGRAEGRRCLGQAEENPVIGVYHTNYDKTLPRAANIALAASRINGMVLQPGEMFSFSEAVLSRVPENGYVMAPAIGGMEYGGGICQVSSTLYAAMCHGMLPALERYPHSSPISYMPEGLDATISEGRKDLKFVNPYDKPLTIWAVPDETGLTASLVLVPDEQREDAAAAHEAQWIFEEQILESEPAPEASESQPVSDVCGQEGGPTAEVPGQGSGPAWQVPHQETEPMPETPV